MAEKDTQEITIGGIEVFRLNVATCTVSCRARLIRHPVETGQVVFDNKVLDPRSITIRAFVRATDEKTKRSLRDMWRNRTFTFYTVTTREAIYRNMCCVDCSHEEGSEKLDGMDYTIKFDEIMMATSAAASRDTRGRLEPKVPDDANVTAY